MKPIFILPAVALALLLTGGVRTAQARGHSPRRSHATRSAGYGHYGAGPSDTGGHDYARHAGSINARRLSTGWARGHGARQHEVHDYYRHGRGGRMVHVHGYYRR